MELIQVGVIKDDKTIHQSLVQSIEYYPALELAFSAYSFEAAQEHFKQDGFITPDIILLDIGLPGMDDLTAIPYIRERLEKTDIIMLTTFEENEKISSGACSYISKKTSLKVIMDSIFTVFRGGSYMSPSIARKIAQHFMPIQHVQKTNLTARQEEIVQKLAEGLSYKMIAAELDISIDTVRSHIKNIYKTLEVNSKIEVINWYRDERRG